MDALQIDVSGLKNLITTLTKDTVREILSTPDEQRKRFLTRAEVAELLRVSMVTLNQWGKSGTLTPCKLGGRVYYDKLAVHDLIGKRRAA